MEQILLCTDLDRTLLPNGIQPESPAARPLFKKLVAAPFVTLAYVSGRSFSLLQQAINDYDLPEPDFMIGDVGTTIYRNSDGKWLAWNEWQNLIGEKWQETLPLELADCLHDLEELELQEPEKQSRFKLSYYTDPNIDFARLTEKVRLRMVSCQAKVKLVCSIDEVNRVGLFDVLPEAASKLQAVRFLIEKTGINLNRTVYGGDSGNDLEVLTSEINAILVANALDEVRHRAGEKAPHNSLYLARGNFLTMNGNYAAGLLEGVMHYLPELKPLIAD